MNHLGYRLEYVDVSKTLPAEVISPTVLATVSWFDAPLADPARFVEWAAGAETSCSGELKQIVIGDIGTPQGADLSGDRKKFLERLGLELNGNEKIIGARAAVRRLNREMIGAEIDFSVEPGRYASYRAAASGRSFLQIVPRREANDEYIDLAVIGERGAYLHDSAAVSFDERSGTAFWVVDPFKFLAAVLDRGVWPVPDVTTMNGRRLFFSTVSSEGWLAHVPARHFDDEPRLGSEILLDRMLRPYPDVPTTVAILQGDLDPMLGGRDALVGSVVAKEAFGLPHVKPATTGASLIRNWDYFASYDRASETRRIDDLRNGAAAEGQTDGLINVAVRGLANALVSEGADAGHVPNAPRKYARDSFDLANEVSGSLRAASAVAPVEKPAAMFLWIGDAEPFEAALEAAELAGVAAMGGGGGIYNSFSPTLSGLSPFSVAVGSQVQIYNGLSGDEAYTNFWSRPAYGFQAMAETLEWTEYPRRLKPFHLAYSAQSTIDFGTRRAVEIMLDRVRTMDVIPVAAAEYPGIVKGFQTFRAERSGAATWRILDRGALNTVRFDNAADLALDIESSTGVLGARRKSDVLYVALQPGFAIPVVALAQSTDASGMLRGDGLGGLSESRVPIVDIKGDGCAVRFIASGPSGGQIVWYGPPDSDFRVTAVGSSADGVLALDQTVRSAPDGRLSFQLPESSTDATEVTISGNC